MKISRAQTITDTEEAENELYEAIAAIKSPEEAKHFLLDLCTPAEIQAMADRWRVVEPVITGKPYRQIYDETGVSVTTIGRVARCIMLGEGGYNMIYERLEKKKRESSSKHKARHGKVSKW